MVVKNSAKLTLSRGKVSVKSLIYDIVVLLVLAAVLVAVLIPAFSDVAAEIAELDIPAKLQQIVANATSVAQSEAAVAEFVGAIEAALNPDDTDYLYFCHNEEGKIYLAKTYTQHQSNWAQALRDNEAN